jgi:hypothetical protein
MNNEIPLKEYLDFILERERPKGQKKIKLLELITCYQIDIILVSETHFKESNKFQRPKYTPYSGECMASEKGG